MTIKPLTPLVALLFTACPKATEVTPPVDPTPLHFTGADILAPDQPVDLVATTAVGGTQTVAVTYDPVGNGVRDPLDLPFDATIVGGTAVIERIDGAKVTIRATAAGVSTLRITDPDTGAVWGEAALLTAVPSQAMVFASGEPLPMIALASELGPAVFPAGEQWLDVAIGDASTTGGIALEGQLIDEGMQLGGPAGATQDSFGVLHVPAAAVGTFNVTATVGGVTLATPIRLVAGADALTLVGDPAQSVHAPRPVCFRATNAGDVVRALPFTFTVEGGAAVVTRPSDPCPTIQAAPGAANVTIHAAAGGQVLTVTLPAL